ncbi:MAG: branched-chain amino acid transaminase [Chloroflexi bacterium]|nr:branched-chain amino acid transaminase [Chloroflexota bacterium]
MSDLCYFRGHLIPLHEARVGIRTHALQYGTGCFAALRGYWTDEEQQLFVLHMKAHFERLHGSARILFMRLPVSVDELIELTLDLLRCNNTRSDVYVRVILFKDAEETGPRLHELSDALAIFTTPPRSNYMTGYQGIRCCISSWRRVDDNGIPARAKVTGLYVNAALARTEAQLNGYDDAIMLTHDGHVSEASVQNLFLVTRGTLHTPAVSENILVGITRGAVLQIAREDLGLQVVERQIDRSELYVADEIFLCGTGSEITPVRDIDGRPIANGEVGPVTRNLQDLYFAAARGQVPKYRHWCMPVYGPA